MSDLKEETAEATLEKVKDKISDALTPEEMNQVTVRWLVNKPDEISFHTSGPEEIINKIREAMSDIGFIKK